MSMKPFHDTPMGEIAPTLPAASNARVAVGPGAAGQRPRSGRRRWLLATLTGTAVLLGAQAQAADGKAAAPVGAAESAQPSASAPHILLLSQRNGPQATIDEGIRQHLERRGYRVTIADQTESPEAAQNMALVVISSTVSAKYVQPGWRHLPVPLLTWENDLLDDLAMTGKRSGQDYGESDKERYLWLVNAPHPMSGGLPAGAANVYVKQAGMSWGSPGLGATRIATLYGQPDKVAIFGYEKGATMDYESLAPARRTMFFLGNEGFSNLQEAGLRLFDAAVDWTLGGSPELATPAPAPGQP